MLFCPFDDKIRKAELGRDGKGITLSRNADEQAVGGPQGLHIKFTAGIFHTGGGEGVNLQLAVMGRGHGTDSLFVKVGQDGNCQCRTFRGIRSGSKLIEKHQGFPVCFFQKGYHVRHMRGERTQRLLDALLVSDICVHLMENGQFRAVIGRNMKPCLSHQGKKSYRFQGNRFTAGVGAGYH